MKLVSLGAAKNTFSKLIERVRKGEEVIITRRSIPVARLVPFEHFAPKRQFGALRGKLVVPKSFFEPLPTDELTP